MPTISISKFSILAPPQLNPRLIFPTSPSNFTKFRSRPSKKFSSFSISKKTNLFHCKSSKEEAGVSEEDEWIQKLPDKKKALYSHSLPCVEAWLKALGFYQSKDDRAVWFVENPNWHAQLSLDVTDLYIRYLKNGPGHLEKEVERRFSYALSREDIENAILGGP